jgi:hypothetical protein
MARNYNCIANQGLSFLVENTTSSGSQRRCVSGNQVRQTARAQNQHSFRMLIPVDSQWHLVYPFGLSHVPLTGGFGELPNPDVCQAILYICPHPDES